MTEQNKETKKECDTHVNSSTTELEKPTMEKYGWYSSTSYEEESGWLFDGGEDAYFKALEKWEKLQ